MFKSLLYRNYYNVTGGTFSFRSGVYTRIIAKSNVNNAALVRCHGTKFYAATLGCCFICRRTSKRFQLLTLAIFITFNINNDGEAETNLTHSDC